MGMLMDELKKKFDEDFEKFINSDGSDIESEEDKEKWLTLHYGIPVEE